MKNVKSEIPAEERAEKIMHARLLALASAAVSKVLFSLKSAKFDYPHSYVVVVLLLLLHINHF